MIEPSPLIAKIARVGARLRAAERLEEPAVPKEQPLEPLKPAKIANATSGNLVEPRGDVLTVEAGQTAQNDEKHVLHEVVSIARGSAHRGDPASDFVEPRVVNLVEVGASCFCLDGRARRPRFRLLLEDVA